MIRSWKSHEILFLPWSAGTLLLTYILSFFQGRKGAKGMASFINGAMGLPGPPGREGLPGIPGPQVKDDLVQMFVMILKFCNCYLFVHLNSFGWSKSHFMASIISLVCTPIWNRYQVHVLSHVWFCAVMWCHHRHRKIFSGWGWTLFRTAFLWEGSKGSVFFVILEGP